MPHHSGVCYAAMALRQLLLVRRLFDEATDFVERGDAVSCGIGISMLQDAAEQYIWALVKARALPARDQSGFVENLDLLRKHGHQMPHAADLLELNRARIGFKHYGNLPAPEDARRHRDQLESALRVAMRSHFDASFDELSSVDLVRDEEIRRYLLAAKACLEAYNPAMRPEGSFCLDVSAGDQAVSPLGAQAVRTGACARYGGV
jgi:hypothetical protein